MKNSLRDLKIILDAIHQVRLEWESAIDEKSDELISLNPKLRKQKAMSSVILHPEVYSIYERLITLYGTLGNATGEYSVVLQEILDMTPKEVISPLKEAA